MASGPMTFMVKSYCYRLKPDGQSMRMVVMQGSGVLNTFAVGTTGCKRDHLLLAPYKVVVDHPW